jgi:hypothetical protein
LHPIVPRATPPRRRVRRHRPVVVTSPCTVPRRPALPTPRSSSP